MVCSNVIIALVIGSHAATHIALLKNYQDRFCFAVKLMLFVPWWI